MLVLVRRRGNLFDAVIQALKHANIPVAGADRLKLTEHIAIIDLMNLADALLLPQDDLALAVALKSPLFGLDDDDLFTLARDRKGSLRDALTVHAASDEKLRGRARARLEQCERRFLQRDAVRLLCLAARRRRRPRTHPASGSATRPMTRSTNSSSWRCPMRRKAPASLQGFMAWLRAADTEVKRDMEISRDEVRVMTVHGAKGLEAPVVFLADTTTSPSDTQRLRLIHLPQGNGGKVMVWAGRKADDPAGVAGARNAMLDETEDEYRRLLYVAMTRAADRLIVGGCMPGNMNSVRENSWYDLIEQGSRQIPDCSCQEIKAANGVVKRYSRSEDVRRKPLRRRRRRPRRAIELPSWLRTAAAPAHARRQPAAPVRSRPMKEARISAPAN